MSSIDIPQVHSCSLHTSRSAHNDIIIDIHEKSASHQSRSDPSPTWLSRLQEKVNLQGLNDRLAAYIVKVHRLEAEKNRLAVQITALQNTISTEVSSVRCFYKKQLEEFQQTLCKTAREKAKFHLELDEQTLKNCERDQLTKQVHDLQHQLEIELLARADLEKRNVMLMEELAFNKKMYAKEMASKQAEISVMSARLDKDFLARFQCALQEFRKQYEEQMQHNRDETGTQLYRTEMQNLEGLAAAQRNDIITHLKEMSLDKEHSSFGTVMNELREEIDQFRGQMIVQLQEHQDLMDIGASLDLEIGAFRKLLEVEESRLNSILSSESRSASARTQTQVDEQLRIKPKVCSLNTGAELVTTRGDVHVVGVDPKGEFIRILNASDKEVCLAGCWLFHETDDFNVQYTFRSDLKIAPYEYITIWSYGTGVSHDPPSNLVMKKGHWPVTPEMVTTLFNESGKVICRRDWNHVQTGFWNAGCSIM